MQTELPTEAGDYYWRENAGAAWQKIAIRQVNTDRPMIATRAGGGVIQFMECCDYHHLIMDHWRNSTGIPHGQWLRIPDADELLAMQVDNARMKEAILSHASDMDKCVCIFTKYEMPKSAREMQAAVNELRASVNKTEATNNAD